MVQLLGRARIDSNTYSSFRTIVAQTDDAEHLCEDILVESGPGPTIVRALKGSQASLLKTVLQCESFKSKRICYIGCTGPTIAYTLLDMFMSCSTAKLISRTNETD